MKIGYGYRVNLSAFDNLGCDKVFIDTEKHRPFRDQIIEARGVRGGDTLALLFLRHLGGSPVADRVWREKVEALGVKIEIHPPQAGDVGRPKDNGKLPPDKEAGARLLWLGGGTELTRLSRVAEHVGHAVGKGLLVGRFGTPTSPKLETPKEGSE